MSPLQPDAPETSFFSNIARSTVEEERMDRAKIKKEENMTKFYQQLEKKIKQKEQSFKKVERKKIIEKKEIASMFEELNDKREAKRKEIARNARV